MWKRVTWSRVILLILTVLYALSSLILSFMSFSAGSKASSRGDSPTCKTMIQCRYGRPALYLSIGLIAIPTSLTTAIVAVNIMRSPDKGRLRTLEHGVGVEKTSIYVFRAVLCSLVPYALMIWIGWAGTGYDKGDMSLKGIFIQDFTPSGRGWNVSKGTTLLIHATT